MSLRPAKPCAYPGCGLLVRGASHCARHAPIMEARRAEYMKRTHKQYNKRRDASDSFYKTKAWVSFRRLVLMESPLCVECERVGRVTAAVILDHIKPLKTHPGLALERSNVRPLCRHCHNAIGARVGLAGGGGGSKLQG